MYVKYNVCPTGSNQKAEVILARAWVSTKNYDSNALESGIELVGNLTIIGSDNGLSPGRCQAII